MKSERTKACGISQKVKKIVWARDGERCVLCGNRQAMPNAHCIPRSKGGLGVERNVVTLCMQCHFDYDQTTKHTEIDKEVREYLRSIYDDWDEEKLFYGRW